jgi:site-specific DNA-adenine methylase
VKTSSILDRPDYKPFLQWAGGKRQLLDESYKRLPFSIVKEGDFVF